VLHALRAPHRIHCGEGLIGHAKLPFGSDDDAGSERFVKRPWSGIQRTASRRNRHQSSSGRVKMDARSGQARTIFVPLWERRSGKNQFVLLATAQNQ
jgi:hypothetical protein